MQPVCVEMNRMKAGRVGYGFLVQLGLLALMVTPAAGFDWLPGRYSPRDRERPQRLRTDYVILHTTEGPGAGSYRKLFNNGEAHFMVDRNGRVYKIIRKEKVAYHCGVSMWNGRRNIDNYSIGIEVVGYHNGTITEAQYATLRKLLTQLQRLYGIPDERVLAHCQVAYGEPNKWHRWPHRGRKRCGLLFTQPSVRNRLGLYRRALYDPDVAAGRLVVGDPYLAEKVYGERPVRPPSGASAAPSKASASRPGQRLAPSTRQR